MQADIASLRQQTGQITEHLADELKQAQDDRDAAQVELAETSRQLAELEAKVAKMPERQQRKFGFI